MSYLLLFSLALTFSSSSSAAAAAALAQHQGFQHRDDGALTTNNNIIKNNEKSGTGGCCHSRSEKRRQFVRTIVTAANAAGGGILHPGTAVAAQQRSLLVSAAAEEEEELRRQTKREWDAAGRDSTNYPVRHSLKEWQSLLVEPMQYDVLRLSATEPPFTSRLNEETRVGTYRCAGCQSDLFGSESKFNSGTGWPSFSSPLLLSGGGGVSSSSTSSSTVAKRQRPSAVEIEPVVLPTGIRRLSKAIVTMKEVRCSTCGGHLGHVFDDGFLFPFTTAFETNNRFCINGAALVFVPSSSSVAPAPDD